MRVSFCPNCMREAAGPKCPRCGLDLDGCRLTADVLPKKTMLGGRYMICGVSRLSQADITYGLLDLEGQGRAEAKEYFPQGIASRDADCTLIWPENYTAGQIEAACESYLGGLRRLKSNPLPGMAPVREFLAENGTVYAISDCPEGEALESWVEVHGPMPPDVCRGIFCGLCETVKGLHDLGMLYGSIDPRHIVLLSGGGACLLAPGGGDAERPYRPPEAGNREDTGTWSDVYALCASAYYGLTGSAPPDVYARGQGGEIVWNDSIPDEMSDTFKQGLVLAFRDRLQTMCQVKNGLDGGITVFQPPAEAQTMVLRPEDVELKYFDATTDPYEDVKKQEKQKKKKRTLFSLATLAFFAAAVFLGLTLARLMQPRQDPGRQETASEPVETDKQEADDSGEDGDSHAAEDGSAENGTGESNELEPPDGSGGTEDVPLALDHTEFELEKGDIFALKVLGGQEVTWSSSGPKTASVDEHGVVTANAVGTATITAEDNNGGQASCAIVVPGVVSIELDATSLLLSPGESHTFTPELVQFGSREAKLQAASSDPGVVSVSGMTATAVGEGRATLMFFTSGGMSSTCEVTVRGARDPQQEQN